MPLNHKQVFVLQIYISRIISKELYLVQGYFLIYNLILVGSLSALQPFSFKNMGGKNIDTCNNIYP